MIEEIKLPEISENVESGSVVSVLIKQGDPVKKDDPVIEVETDKASVEVPSTASGTVSEVLVSEGDDVKVGATIVKIDTEGGGEGGGGAEEASADTSGGAAGQKEKPAAEKPAAEKPAETAPTAEQEKPAAEKPAAEQPAATDGGGASGGTAPAAPQETKTADAGRQSAAGTPTAYAEPSKPVPAAPSTRRLAREIGVDVYQVEGSGPGGRISQEDVKAFAKRALKSGAGGPAMQQPKLPDFSKWGEIRREPMSNVRKITAQSMQTSWQTVPHVTQFDKADVTELENFRQKYGKVAEKAGGKLTVTAMILKIAAHALQRYPNFNASIDMQQQEIIYKDYVHIGVAVDTDRGLLVPVVRDVPQKSIVTLSVELAEIAGKARDKKIKPEDMEGGTFTISNLGGIGGTAFTPVVYSPQVAILGLARSEWQPVYQNGQFEPRLTLPLSLSYDHRLIDGADGARFLRFICQSLENPLYMSLEGGR
jgi:pyruvate dehydrogenase E2 component (dihydrolipoamide acetyltransferase)